MLIQEVFSVMCGVPDEQRFCVDSVYVLLALTIKTAGCFISKRRVYSGLNENCNLGQTSCGRTVGKSREQGDRCAFTRRKGIHWEGCYKLKSIGVKWKFEVWCLLIG